MMGSKTIMIVDDDEDDRFFFREAVSMIDSSYGCAEAEHGVDALEQLRRSVQLPDYIFLDLNMPLMDGKKFLIELKKEEQFKNIPVIIYSTSNQREDMEMTRKLGAIHFMTKTSDLKSLPANIIMALEKANEFAAI